VADLRVELGAARSTDGLTALLADLLVELVPALRLDRLAPLAADLLVECPAALLGDFHSALAPGLGNGHSALLFLCHFPASGGWKEPPSPPPSAPARGRAPGVPSVFTNAPLKRAYRAPAILAYCPRARARRLSLGRRATLLADLLVQYGAAFRLDGVAALLADLLVEGAAPLRLHRLAALAADLLVEGVPVLVAH